MKNLSNHKEPGAHTEMLFDGVIPLIEKGIIDNSGKQIDVGKSVPGFIAGTRRVYDFVIDNPSWINTWQAIGKKRF